VQVQQFDDTVLKFYPQPKDNPDGTPGEPNPGVFSRHLYKTGEPVRFAGAKELPAAKPAIALDRSYFVHVLNETEITLHTGPAQAESGENPMRFVTAGQGNQHLYLGSKSLTVSWWGPKLNFMHSVFLAALIALGLHVLISLFFPAPDDERRRLTWTELGGHSPGALRKAVWKLVASLGLFALLGWMMHNENIAPLTAGLIAGAWTWLMFLDAAIIAVISSQVAKSGGEDDSGARGESLLEEDRFWGGLLCGVAVFMLFYFM
jgi:hypothetical protein